MVEMDCMFSLCRLHLSSDGWNKLQPPHSPEKEEANIENE